MLLPQHNVYLVTALRQNCNAASLLLFLYRVVDVDVLKHYFEELEEASLRDNFVVVYELLDELWGLATYNILRRRFLVSSKRLMLIGWNLHGDLQWLSQMLCHNTMKAHSTRK